MSLPKKLRRLDAFAAGVLLGLCAITPAFAATRYRGVAAARLVVDGIAGVARRRARAASHAPSDASSRHGPDDRGHALVAQSSGATEHETHARPAHLRCLVFFAVAAALGAAFALLSVRSLHALDLGLVALVRCGSAPDCALRAGTRCVRFRRRAALCGVAGERWHAYAPRSQFDADAARTPPARCSSSPRRHAAAAMLCARYDGSYERVTAANRSAAPGSPAPAWPAATARAPPG